jgi:hypothetical protein
MSIRSNKYVFTLKNVNTENIDNKYGIILVSNIDTVRMPSDNITKISELNTERQVPEVVSFLDESKKLHQCVVSMIDFSTNTETVLLRYNCYWCRHPFNSIPIGCPVKYVSSQAIKSYYSEISKDIYTIKENITVSRSNSITDPRIIIKKKEFYETDGIFCSFNCCKAYIKDNKHNRLYDMSDILLIKMYNDVMKCKSFIIDPAPHWRLLREYGGNLTVSEFRNSFNKIDYECHGNIKSFPEYRSAGMLFEEKIKF